MKKKEKLFLAVILLAGFIMRLFGLINIRLGGDFAYHWEVAGSIAKGENFPLLGPAASINPDFHLGPFYYYFLAISHFLGAGNFKVAIVFFSLISSISIYFLYHLSREWFSEEESLKVTALYAFSSYMITTGNFPWNAYLVPLVVILILLLLTRLKKGRHKYIVPLAFLYAVGLQLHATVILLTPLLLLAIPYKKIKIKYLILSLVVFVLIISPWLVVEFGSGFEQTKNLFSTLFVADSDCVFSEWIVSHGHGERCFHYFRNTLFIFRLFSVSLFVSTNFWLVILTFLVSIHTLFLSENPARKFFITWLTGVFILYLFYSANIYLHYMLILVPLPFFVMGMFLQRIEKPRNGKLLSNLIFVLMIANNLVHFLISLRDIRI